MRAGSTLLDRKAPMHLLLYHSFTPLPLLPGSPNLPATLLPLTPLSGDDVTFLLLLPPFSVAPRQSSAKRDLCSVLAPVLDFYRNIA